MIYIPPVQVPEVDVVAYFPEGHMVHAALENKYAVEHCSHVEESVHIVQPIEQAK